MFLTLNSRVIEDPAAGLSLLDRGFLLGDGIFETMRVYSGKAFKLSEHLKRLALSAKHLGIELDVDLEALARREIQRARDAGLSDAYLRITLTRGNGLGVGADPENPSLVTLIDALPALNPAWYSRGVRITTSSGRRNEFAVTAGLKTTAYMDSIVAFRAARANADDVLFLDTQGHLSEATASNIFLYVGGKLLTPPLGCGALPGITRATVLGIARAAGIPIADDIPIDPSTLMAASEAFLTSSIREVVPIISVDGRKIASGLPGPVFGKISKAYAGMTRP